MMGRSNKIYYLMRVEAKRNLKWKHPRKSDMLNLHLVSFFIIVIANGMFLMKDILFFTQLETLVKELSSKTVKG